MQAMISALMILVACGFEGQSQPPTYGQVIEAMAEAAPGFGDSRLTALVSDLSLQYLERGRWAESDARDTLRVLGGRLRNRGRSTLRSRHVETARKRAQRLRKRTPAGETPPLLPVAREVLDAQPDAACDRLLHRLEARDQLRALGFDSLPPPGPSLPSGNRRHGAALSGGCRNPGSGVGRAGAQDPQPSPVRIASRRRRLALRHTGGSTPAARDV